MKILYTILYMICRHFHKRFSLIFLVILLVKELDYGLKDCLFFGLQILLFVMIPGYQIQKPVKKDFVNQVNLLIDQKLFLVLLQLWLHNGDKREPEFIKFDMVLICAFSQNI